MNTDRTPRYIKLDERNHVENPLLDQLDGLDWEIIDLDNKQHPADSHRDSFTEVVMLPGAARAVEGHQSAVGTPTVTPTVRALLELLHKTGDSGSIEIRKAFELKDRVHVHKSYLQPALKSGYIEMTIPDKPNSRLQKYRLTDGGKRLLKSMQK